MPLCVVSLPGIIIYGSSDTLSLIFETTHGLWVVSLWKAFYVSAPKSQSRLDNSSHRLDTNNNIQNEQNKFNKTKRIKQEGVSSITSLSFEGSLGCIILWLCELWCMHNEWWKWEMHIRYLIIPRKQHHRKVWSRRTSHSRFEYSRRSIQMYLDSHSWQN